MKKISKENKMTKTGCFLIKRNALIKILSLLFIFNIFVFPVFSTPLETIKISINKTETTLGKILDELESKTGYSILVRVNDIDLNEIVSINESNKNLYEILAILFEGKTIKYEVSENRVTIYKPMTFSGNSDIQQQDGRRITGTVSDENGELLTGVYITVKGTSIGSITDSEGKYILQNVPSNATLVFKFLGMKNSEIAVEQKQVIDMVMVNDKFSLEEVVVIGYGTQKKATLTGSVSSVSAKDINNIPTNNLASVLAGRMSGVYVSQSSGRPGETASIKIRALNTFATGTGVGDPLFVIDGITQTKADFNILDPNDIQDISILKDAASTAIYGARGGNGVVLVTTKSGLGKPKINATASITVEKPTKIPEMIDVVTNILQDNIIFGPDHPSYFTEDEIDYFRKNGRFDWLKEAYTTPVTNHYTVNLAGAKDSTKYYMAGSYYNQGGFLPNLKYTRYNFRSNFETKVTDRLTAGAQLGYTQTVDNRYNFTYDYGSGDLNNLWGKLLYYNFWVPPYIDGMAVDAGWVSHPIEQMRNGGYDRRTGGYMDVQMWANYKMPFINGLSIKFVYGLNKSNDSNKTFKKKVMRYEFERTGGKNHIFTNKLIGSKLSDDPAIESIEYWKNNYSRYQANVQLTYDRKIGEHNINAILAYDQEMGDNSNLNAGRNNFPVILKDQFWAASQQASDRWNNASEGNFARVSYVGRLTYDYSEKYLLQTSLRREGSTQFAPKYRWGYFPSISGGWRISKEDFWKLESINYLKLRATLGIAGYDYVSAWNWMEKYVNANSYIFGTSVNNGINYGGIVNDRLTWERAKAINFGADFAFVNQFTASIDYWRNNQSKILSNRILFLPSTFGATMPAENYGETESHGIELELGYHNSTKFGLNYSLKATYGWRTNKVTKIDVAQNVLDADNPIGKPLGYITGYNAAGILRTQADLDALPEGYTIHGRTPALGMINFEDVNGPSGIPDGKIDGYDRVVIAKYGYNPHMFGLLMSGDRNGITLEVFFEGQAGGKKLYNDGYGRRYPAGNLAFAHWADSWSPENPNAAYPKPVDWDVTADHYESTFWLHNAGFVRLRYVNLGYAIPTKWSNKLGLQQLKLFVSGTNIFYLTGFKFYDPEVNSQMSYPNMKTLNLGLSLTL